MNADSPSLADVPPLLRQDIYRLCEKNLFSHALRLLRASGFSHYGLEDLDRIYYAERRRAGSLPPTDPAAAPAPPAEPENPNALQPANGIVPKRRDKIAHLPKDIRNELNTMLDNGATYDQIIQWLAEKGHPDFNKSNLSRWQRGGFQDWLRQTEQLDAHALQREWLLDRVAEVNPDELLPLVDKLFVTEFLDSVFGLDTVTLKQRLATSPRDFIALFNAYRRLKRDLTPDKNEALDANNTPAQPLRVVTPGNA